MKKDDCIFCKLAAGEIPSITLYEDDLFRVFFDISPASKGHCLVIPKEHYDNLFEIPEEVGTKAFALAKKVATVLKEELSCDGLNILQNNGSVAGQTIFHFHLHIIPRFEGDALKLTWTQGEADMDALNALAQKVGAKL